MPLVNRILACAFSSCLLFSSANAVGDENLAEILRNAKWDGIVGTWVDEKYQWQIPKLYLFLENQK